MAKPAGGVRDADGDRPPAQSDRRGYRRWIARVGEYRTQLEGRPRLGLPLRSLRRFNEIDGKHLALVIAANLFIAVIPLIILGYAFFVAFNPHHSFGAVIVRAFHISGSTAQIVEATFSNARSGRNTALSISVISLLITGLDVSATVQTAYARAFRVRPLSGVRKYVRGAAWLIVLLTMTGAGLTLRYSAASVSAWYLLLLVPAYFLLQFGFFIATPRLLLDLPFAWRDVARGAVVATAAATVVAAVSSFELRRWISGYSAAYGGYGTALSIIAYVGVLALFWVWIAAVMGAYWEHEAGTEAVTQMQQRSSNADR